MRKLLLFYRRRLGSHFFLRLVVIHFLITLLSISVMTFFIMQTANNLLTDQAIRHNMQSLESVNTYFENQSQSFKKILSSFYTASISVNDGMMTPGEACELFGQEDGLPDVLEQINVSRSLSSYLSECLVMDSNINDILLVSTDGRYLYSSRFRSVYSTTSSYAEIAAKISACEGENINARKINYLSPAELSQGETLPMLYVSYDYIRNAESTSKYSGYLVAMYNPDFIKNLYNQFSPYLLGDIFIVSDEGQLLFSSSGSYGSDVFSDAAALRSLRSGTQQAGSDYVNVIWNDEFDYYVIGCISQEDLRQNTDPLNGVILLVAATCVCAIFFLGYENTKKLSGRIFTINNTLMEIENGNLRARAEVSGANDEIRQIAVNLNHMSERLEEYIQKEYQVRIDRTRAELKQKTAELYALQTQIDPHFLYNTLEAIRMNAVKSRDRETAEMIKILARLFRISTKADLIATVREEVDYCLAYLSLLNIRYQGRLQVECDISPDIETAAIPKRLLQPLVENAVVHGMDLSHEENCIRLEGCFCGDKIRLSVTDNGKGIEKEKLAEILENLERSDEVDFGRIGLYNVHNRIRLVYGRDCGLTVESEQDHGARITVTIANLTKEELLKNVQGSGGR